MSITNSFSTNIQYGICAQCTHTHIHTQCWTEQSNTKIQFFIALFRTSSYMRFQCDTSLCANVCISVLFSLFLFLFHVPSNIESLQFHPSAPPIESISLHLQPFWFHLLVYPISIYCLLRLTYSASEWMHCTRSMQPFGHSNPCKIHSIHFHTREKKSCNISIDKLSTWWNILRHDSFVIIHPVWLFGKRVCVCVCTASIFPWIMVKLSFELLFARQTKITISETQTNVIKQERRRKNNGERTTGEIQQAKANICKETATNDRGGLGVYSKSERELWSASFSMARFYSFGGART